MPAAGEEPYAQQFATRLAAVEERIAAACRAAGRAREEVTLVAVTKTRSDEEVLAAARCGLRDLGENRVEELEARREALCDALPADVRWHMIGHVQSRKAARAAAAAALVHSVDSVRLAERLDRAAQSLGGVLPVLLR